MNTDTEQVQLFPLVVLLYCDSSQREIDLLINATNAVCFLAILKMLFTRASCDHVVLLLLTTVEQDMHIQSCIHVLYVCTATSHLTISQHTAGFFHLFAASKLDGLPYIFSYAHGRITGAGIPLK